MGGRELNLTPYLALLGIILIFAGIALIFLSALPGESKVWGGGLILIGPIPLFFGGESPGILLLALIIFALSFILILFMIIRGGFARE